MNCQKCGAELRKEQKVCIVCGTPTPAGGNFYVEEDKKWTPSLLQKCIGGGVVLVLLILIIANMLKVVPPEKVAQKWVDALVSRQVKTARNLSTPTMEQNLQTGFDLVALSDDYNSRVVADEAEYKVAKPVYSDPSNANVKILFATPDGSVFTVNLDMIKQGRRWMVDRVR